MTKNELVHIVSKQETLDKSKVLTWIKQLANDSVVVNKLAVGDVVMFKPFSHPAIIFKIKKNNYICGLLTTNEDCDGLIEKCKCRFLENSYFTATLMSTTQLYGKFMGVYENKKHLKEVYNKIISRLIL